MKKTKKIIILSIFAIFASCVFIGCTQNSTQQLKNNTSEITKTFFVGNEEDYYITLSSGCRESDYTFDGKTTDLIDFAVITLQFSTPKTDEFFDFEIIINNTSLSGTLAKNPYKTNYMCDLSRELSSTDQIQITLLDKTTKLECKSKDFSVDFEQAQALAIDKLSQKIDEITQNKYECYLKILYKPEVSDNYFWYFLVKSDKYYNLVIDCQNGQIVANY